jgi:endo-beta-N-acetylglucosaminidase D
MHDMQNRPFEQHEDAISRNGQGFSNYLLDQTVVQDNNMYNNGTIGHGTVWNATADALVKANPDRFEIVNTPNYWQGIDY